MNIPDLRIGHGYDVHKFAAPGEQNKPLILAGIEIPATLSLIAHSDGDVVLHAVCDAILGAIAAGDIGQHFPDSDQRFKNIASTQLLVQVYALARQRNWQLVNVDITVVAEVPKLAAFRQAMATNITEILQLGPERVNIKATTTEKMGYLGREEGMACHAVVLLSKQR